MPRARPVATEGHGYITWGNIPAMPQRPKRIRLLVEAYANPETAFHIVISAHPGVTQFSTAIVQAVWATVLEQVDAGRVQLFAACLMPDHVHLLLRPKEMDVIAFMNVWKRWSTRAAWSAGHRGPLWQPSFYDRGITHPDDFDAAAGYIVMNPVTAGFVKEIDEWPWTWPRYPADR